MQVFSSFFLIAVICISSWLESGSGHFTTYYKKYIPWCIWCNEGSWIWDSSSAQRLKPTRKKKRLIKVLFFSHWLVYYDKQHFYQLCHLLTTITPFLTKKKGYWIISRTRATTAHRPKKFRFADLRSHTFSLKKPKLYWNPDKEKSKAKFSITTNQSTNGRDIASSSINTVLQKQTSPWTVFLL